MKVIEIHCSYRPCVLPDGHKGDHVISSLWRTADNVVTIRRTCPAILLAHGQSIQCDLPLYHVGEHRGTVQGTSPVFLECWTGSDT